MSRFLAGSFEVRAQAEARNLPRTTIERIRVLHHEWLCDTEIGERVGCRAAVVWHARQFNNIDRHRNVSEE